MQTNRKLLLAVVLMVVIGLVAVGVAVAVTHSSTASATDAALQTTLQAIKTDVSKPGSLPVRDPTLQSFQAWVYNIRASFLKSVHHETRLQFAQIVLNDPNTMPPQTLGLNQLGHPVTGIPLTDINQARTSTDVHCGDTVYNGRKLRFCVSALKTPAVLQSSNVTGLLTVLSPEP